MVDPILGPVENRVKTDVRLPKVLSDEVSDFCLQLGIPKNVFFTLAAVNMLSGYGDLPMSKKRSARLSKMQSDFQSIFERLLTEA